MKTILLPSGENTQSSDRGAETSWVRELRRLVWPEAASATQTLLSMMCAIRGLSGLQVKAEATDHGFLVTCPSEPPLGETVQSCTILALSSIRNAIWQPSSELRNEWRGPWMTGNLRSALNVSRR